MIQNKISYREIICIPYESLRDFLDDLFLHMQSVEDYDYSYTLPKLEKN